MVELRDIVTFIALALAVVNLSSNYHLSSGLETVEWSTHTTKRSVEAVLPDQVQSIQTLEGVVQELTQILMKVQSTLEQRIRFEGGSGVTEARGYGAGTQSYYQSTHNTLNIHDHADFIDTMGMGEFSAVLNGVEFTTRHNDYRLVMPVANDLTYHKTTPIPHPEVPPSVLAKPTVLEQVAEMREYFRAFATQNSSIRNYKPYFKAQLCYLEGTWIKDSTTLQDPFASDRHSLDAATWKILNEKYRFLMNNGQKNNLENLAWLPTAVRDTTEREDFDFKNIGGTTVMKPLAETSSFYPVAKGIFPIPDLPDQTLVTGVFKKVEGNYLGIYNSPSTVDQVFRVNVTCGTDSTGQMARGCYSLTKAAICVGATSCPITAATGKGSWLFTATAGKVSGFLYGPIGAYHNITVTFENVTGISKYMLVSDPKGKNFTLSNKGFEYTGNVFPTTPVVSNYEYRILCNPIDGDLPTDRFRIYEDNAAFARDGKNKSTMASSRRALFFLNPVNRTAYYESATTYEFIDQLMEKIPGKNNHGCKLSDKSFGSTTQHYLSATELNVCYYSRFFSLSETDAMGRSQRRRGYNDPTLWAAMTTAANVVGQPVYDDVNQEQLNQKWSYAIPLEIVYMTPLSSWNPYNLKTWTQSDPAASVDSVTAGGRNGGLNASNCYNQTSYKVFYRTPAEFFSPKAGESDPADTSNPEIKGVCDAAGNVYRVYRSGHSCFLPAIDGLPLIRQRYPIFPLHEFKDFAHKESKAAQRIFTWNGSKAEVQIPTVSLWTSYSTTNIAAHQHDIELGAPELAELDLNGVVVVTTSLAAAHTHSIKIQRIKVGDNYQYLLIDCDEEPGKCFDGHDHVCTDPNCLAYPKPPTPPPTAAPVAAPVAPPVAAPVSAPVASPVTPPVTPPVASPVAPPVAAPVDAPVAPPVASPVAPPVSEPVSPPVASPVSPPASAPSSSPIPPPVAEPSASPVSPPVASPVAPPVASPVASPTSDPSSCAKTCYDAFEKERASWDSRTHFFIRCTGWTNARKCLQDCKNETEVAAHQQTCETTNYINELCDCGNGRKQVTGGRYVQILNDFGTEFNNNFTKIKGVISGQWPSSVTGTKISIPFKYDATQAKLQDIFSQVLTWLSEFLNSEKSNFSVKESTKRETDATMIITVGDSSTPTSVPQSNPVTQPFGGPVISSETQTSDINIGALIGGIVAAVALIVIISAVGYLAVSGYLAAHAGFEQI